MSIIAAWVRDGRIKPIEPIFLLFHIWALTQHYADYEPQVRFFTKCPPDELLDRETICTQVIGFVLGGVGLQNVGGGAADNALTGNASRLPTDAYRDSPHFAINT